MSEERRFDVDCAFGHVTRDGRRARIVFDGRLGYGQPLVGLYMNAAGTGEIISGFCRDGRYSKVVGVETPIDLFNAEAPAPPPDESLLGAETSDPLDAPWILS